ncbi:ribosomal-processing cysteine protease Prp [Mycoplasma sp. E35C]|uniref:ribosomal-processing cysteine protease Prp n=1 Tax=Mycoplasma sp. E35C TaxID=2801918 RepID=UPI001CA3E480|nr:ribosomal-processing cysteine protease Prp [Mycoplasma sp. E35C]QZX49451.1 ribosomal-processing cysteine protease Prp [Mycoplasma sp. E35C]
MIHITLYASAIKIEGHAFFDNPGHDIVCAGVSAIVFGGINYFEQNEVKIVKDDENSLIFLELLEVNLKNLTAINVMKTQLWVIAKVYDKNIKIIDETNKIVTGK